MEESRKNMSANENLGLTTSAALQILKRDIKRVLDEFEEECRKNK